MKSKSYRIEVSGNGRSFSVSFSNDEKDVFDVFEKLSEKFSFDKNYSVKVFKIEIEETLLTIENWNLPLL
jgi:hypothetical protein